MGIQLGSTVVNNIFGTKTIIIPAVQTTVSSSVVGLLSGSYSNGAAWPSTTGSDVAVGNSPLVGQATNGRWQFNGTDDFLTVTQSTLNATFNTNSATAVQQFTLLFYGTIGSVSTRRALYGANGADTAYNNGGDAILRTDTSPGAGKMSLDLRGYAGNTNRFTLTADSGSLLNIAIVQSANASQSVYQDGVLVATSGALGDGYAPWRSNGGTAGASLCYNQDSDTDNYNGQLGGIFLYNRVLTATEISESAQAFYTSTTGSTSVGIASASAVYLGNNILYPTPTTTTTTTSTTTTAAPFSAMTLVVAGGGSGGTGTGGGGGAGGVVYSSSLTLPNGTYAVNVGTGGAAVGNNGGSSPSGRRGQDSSFVSGAIIVSASGGGGGKGYDVALGAANNGGSGGGGTANSSVGGTGISGQGFNGGNWNGSDNGCGSGGGGAAQVGQTQIGAYPNGSGGNGGSGSQYTLRAGTSVFYGGGGGGGNYVTSNLVGKGGPGGGTDGSKNTTNPLSASANTGGGGGGSHRSATGTNNGISGNGGSGIIIIAYTTSSAAGKTITGGIEETYTSASLTYKSHTFLSSSNLVIS